MTGDYYSARSQGIVVRNGTLYRDVPNTDVCVLYNDGEMKTYDSAIFNLTDAVTRGIWQSWSFGPPLLDENGGKLSEFNSTLTDRHPRSAIGFYAPGHYCFVVVDGRQKGLFHRHEFNRAFRLVRKPRLQASLQFRRRSDRRNDLSGQRHQSAL